MKTIKQKNIAKKAGISEAMLSMILSGKARPCWKTAKRLSFAVPVSSPIDWMESDPDHLRQIITNLPTEDVSQ